MAFIQVITFESTNVDAMVKLGDEFEKAIGADNKARRAVLAGDRDHPGTYVQIIFFDSYEEAMENSNNPATQKIAAGMAELASGPPTFSNLDVIEDRQM